MDISGDYCLDGITRRNVINVCKANGIPSREELLSHAGLRCRRAFVTGTFAGLRRSSRWMGERSLTHSAGQWSIDFRDSTKNSLRQRASWRATAVAEMTIRIAGWSGPRNISTAMMRAWESRPDCCVVDEPFYGCYLLESGAKHPMRERLLPVSRKLARALRRSCAQANHPFQYENI